MHERRPFDVEAYIQQTLNESCFLCEIASGNPEYSHHVVYQDDFAIAFLNNYPTLYGQLLLAPIEHREQVTEDFTLDEYLALQALVYRLSGALRQVVPTERIYILSLGSQQANNHVHWHIAPLPPEVPYDQQQFEALQIRNGILDIPDGDMAELARRISRELQDD